MSFAEFPLVVGGGSAEFLFMLTCPGGGFLLNFHVCSLVLGRRFSAQFSFMLTCPGGGGEEGFCLIFIYAHLSWGGGGFCSIFIYAHLSWGGGVLLNFHLCSLVRGGGGFAQFSFMLTCPGGGGEVMHKFSYMLTGSTTLFFHIFKIVKMGRKKGQKVMIKKGKAALHLEQHWAFNFDNVSEDSLITKGHVLYYLIDNTVLNLIDKLLPLLKTDTRSRLYGRAHHLYQLYAKKNHRNLSAECNMITFDKFCQESFMVNLPLEETSIVPQMTQTEDITEASQVTANEATRVIAEITPCLKNPATPVKTRFGNNNLEMLVRTQRQVIAKNESTIRELESQLKMKKPVPERKIIKVLNEKLNRRDCKISVLKETPTRKEIALLKRQIGYWKKKATSPKVGHFDANDEGDRGGQAGYHSRAGEQGTGIAGRVGTNQIT